MLTRLDRLHGRAHIIVKDWGWEEIVENNDLYCLKIITCIDRKWSSKGKFHYHRIKDETFWVKDGVLELDIQEEDGPFAGFYLRERESIRIKPGVKHRFRSVHNKCVFIEASTHDSESDSIRCQYVLTDKKVGEWVEG